MKIKTKQKIKTIQKKNGSDAAGRHEMMVSSVKRIGALAPPD